MTSADHRRTSDKLRERLGACPAGRPGWRQFEDVALDVLCHLLVPPLVKPKVQVRTLSGMDRRDAVFPNRIADSSRPWGLLRRDHDARYVLTEFKNYDHEDIGKDEVDQTRNYLNKKVGRLALIVCNKPPHDTARRRRTVVFTEEGKVILFVTTAHLQEMLDMKDRGDDPANLILDLVDDFLLEHE